MPKSFFWDLVGALGAPILAGTLVACLLEQRLALLHVALMGGGLAFMVLGHWHEHRMTNRSE